MFLQQILHDIITNTPYLDEGWIHIDNNLAENAIRPITLGRKNYLFCGNHDAAKNMSIICSLLGTCKEQHVNPRLWLDDILAKMPYMAKASDKEKQQLLPQYWIKSHPEATIVEVQYVSISCTKTKKACISN